MGRDKGANRSKGNVKPANSGRSAELLGQSFGKEGLIPTSLLSGSSFVSILGSTSSSLQNDESQLDSNLTILLRKLGKKDSTTKIKALSELNDICTSDPEVCTQILVYWPNYYVKLARDEDRKVRELSHVVLQIIGNNVGRNLATQIKNLFPVWFLSTSDTFAVVSTKAQTTFTNIFPTIDKQVQVCKFCCKEIFEFIQAEKMFQGNELSKVTAIEGIIKLIQMGVCDGDETVSPEEQEFDIDMKSDGFWNLGKDESSLVRRSFYTLLTLLAERKLERLNPEKNRLNQIMKISLTDEKSELESLWNCFLTLIMKGFYPDKGFAKQQILICCKNGFYGNASVLGPLLLPLVDKVGPFSGEELYNALGKGYDLEKGTNEGAAILRTYAEILSYDFKTKKQVPSHTFPFIFQNLNSSHEFGRVIGNFLKASADTFYEELKTFIFEADDIYSLQTSPAFGTFILSFIEPLKRKTKFREFGQNNPNLGRKETYDYDGIDDTKKSFMKDISRKLVEWKAWKPFSVISKNLASTGFFNDVALEPQNLEFTEDLKIEGLRIILDLMKFQESEKSEKSKIFEQLVSKYFEGDNVSSFLREIESGDSYDSVPPVQEYLQSSSFLTNQNSSVTKYILKKGVAHFTPEIIGEQITRLCDCTLEDVNLPLIQEIMNLSSGGKITQNVNMSRLYLKIWEMFLGLLSQQTAVLEDVDEETASLQSQVGTPTQEKIEQISSNIIRNNRLPKSDLFAKILQYIPNCQNIIGLNNLVDIALKTAEENYTVSPCQFEIDPDLLVFLGFTKNPKITQNEILTVSPEFDASKLKDVLKRVYFDSRLVMQLEPKTEELIQLGLNVLFAQCAYEVWRELEKLNWDWKPVDYCEELKTELTRILESLETPQNLNEFWNQVQAQEIGLWDSKYPEKYLMDTCQKMELIIPKKLEEVPLNFGDGIEDVLNYLQHPDADIQALIAALTKERNDDPRKFKFETLFSHLSGGERQQLLNYLVLCIELLKRDADFVSTVACWVSAWLRFGKVMGTGKINYLWVQKLNEAIILIDSISKTNKDTDALFVQEYIEFHAKNIYPVVYSYFIQLTREQEPENIWKQFCSTAVCSAIALTPKPILLSIEPDSAVLFEIFTPILLKNSPQFKLAAYHVLRRTKVKDEVIIPKELSQLLSRKVQDETKHDKVLALLLGWDTLLKTQLNSFELANFVKKDELLPKLLNLLFFKLIPETVNLKSFFETKPNLQPNALPVITHLSCYILQEILRHLPYTVRWWWSLNLKQREKVLVEKLITKYLSSKLAAEELGKVQWNEQQEGDSSEGAGGLGNSDNVTVDSHPGCNELIAKYKIEETNVILKITLPLNHPLGPVDVHVSDKKINVKITQMLNTRSHSLSSGLILWKENLDNKYKEVDECAICFFILHHVTKALPKLACSQCRKKFHAACLYKWFSTSNKSECPLCRNLF